MSPGQPSAGRLAERYVDEGMRMEDHPGIVFRDGPSGRRAAVVGGPDVWEVVAFIQGLDRKGQAVLTETADSLKLTRAQVSSAWNYYVNFKDEVDERITRNADEAQAAEEAWQREQAALS